MKHLTLPNNIETISQLNAFVDTLCEEWSIDMDLAMSLNLAIEEAVVNVMDYAYPEGTVGYVDIEADIDDTYITQACPSILPRKKRSTPPYLQNNGKSADLAYTLYGESWILSAMNIKIIRIY